MFYGIKEEKIWDVCSKMINKRTKDNGIPTVAEFYIEIDDGSYIPGDSYNDITKEISKDSPQRFIEPEKTSEQLRLDDLETKNIDLEARIAVLESKIEAKEP